MLWLLSHLEGSPIDSAKAMVGLRPSFSALVRCCERGARVRFPMAFLLREGTQISPLRFAPVEMTSLLWMGLIFFQDEMVIWLPQNCHLDRSVPGFPATHHWTGPR
jgi:hypothetical protein